jgi:hypothetical protein
MGNKLTFFIGILGVSLFALTTIVGGFLIEDYSVLSQYISETYAIDTEYGKVLRIFGHIPSGILIALFSFLGTTYFQPSKLTKAGFYGLGIFYGMAQYSLASFPVIVVVKQTYKIPVFLN